MCFISSKKWARQRNEPFEAHLLYEWTPYYIKMLQKPYFNTLTLTWVGSIWKWLGSSPPKPTEVTWMPPMQLPSHHDKVRNPLLGISPCRGLCDVICGFSMWPMEISKRKVKSCLLYTSVSWNLTRKVDGLEPSLQALSVDDIINNIINHYPFEWSSLD